MVNTTMMGVLAFFVFALCVMHISPTSAQQQKILFLPLDERFTTRDAFLNLATLAPFSVSTPPTQYLPLWKKPADLNYIFQWVDSQIQNASAVVFSSEMYLYGGLIASRSSNDSTDVVMQRLNKLVSYKAKYPKVKMYVSSVIMRIPAYNSDFEEPPYWADYGYDLYSYSYHMDRYSVLGNITDYNMAQQLAQQIPSGVMEQFLWRRARNHNITVQMVEYEKKFIFEQLFITLDDNSPFGFNIAESRDLIQLVSQYQLQDYIKIYPGADEVGLTMLSRMSTQFSQQKPVTLFLVYRNATTKYYIPNYEGQPMNLTVQQQVIAAGGVIAGSGVSQKSADILLLLNNFNETTQLEAPNQPPPSSRSFTEFSVFLPYLQTAQELGQVVGFADNRFSNGGDLLFVDWIYNISYPDDKNQLVDIGKYGYAGWNTDGNKLGTVISNVIILDLFGKAQQNTLFQFYRFTEDAYYQSIVRQVLSDYVDQTEFDTDTNLSLDLPFYTRFSWKLLSARLDSISRWYNLPYQLISVYYPWNRTFEIGLLIQ